MRNVNMFCLFAAIMFLFACTSDDSKKKSESDMKSDVVTITELKVGDMLGKLRISKINYADGFTSIHFDRDVIVEGILSIDQGQTLYYLDDKLIDCKLDVNGNIYNLSETSIALMEGEKLDKHMPKDALIELNEGVELAEQYKGKLSFKVVMNKIVFESENMVILRGNVSKVLSVNGKKVAKIPFRKEKFKKKKNSEN